MIIFCIGLVIYVVGASLAFVLFQETAIKTYYMSNLQKMVDYVKVLLYSVLWVVFLPILLFGMFKWKK